MHYGLLKNQSFLFGLFWVHFGPFLIQFCSFFGLFNGHFDDSFRSCLFSHHFSLNLNPLLEVQFYLISKYIFLGTNTIIVGKSLRPFWDLYLPEKCSQSNLDIANGPICVEVNFVGYFLSLELAEVDEPWWLRSYDTLKKKIE